MPETSIIVRSFNEEKHIGVLLESLRAQSYRDIEIILVDSGSVDLTRQIAADYCDKIVQISSRDFTFGYSLNAGCRAAEGQYLVIASAHTKPTHNEWLANLLRNFSDERVAMVFGKQQGAANSKVGETRDLLRTFGTRRRLLRPPDYFANNANSAVRRELWEAHPFDEKLPGLEDAEWAKYWMDRGYQVVYEPAAPIYHSHDETWRQVRIRYYREGTAARVIGVKDRSHIPRDLLKEAKNLAGDLLAASVRPHQWGKIDEIVRFRVNKTIGTVTGLWSHSTMMETGERERTLFNYQARAVVIEGPKHAALKEVEIPEVKPGDVLIKVAYVGICATDLEIYDGSLGYYRDGHAHYPIVPGHEYSGQVTVVGGKVSHLEEGDLVVVETVQGCGVCDSCHSGNRVGCEFRVEVGVFGRSGAYADYLVVPGEFVHKLLPSTDLKSATLCEPLSVVIKGVRRLGAAVENPRRIAVVGAGTIGHLTARYLARLGHDVTAFDREPGRLALLSDAGVVTKRELDGLDAFDVAVEATGNAMALDQVVRGMRPGSTILLLGLPYAKGGLDPEMLVTSDKTMIGSVGAGAEDVEEAVRLIGEIGANIRLDDVHPLERYDRAWARVREHASLKVLLEVDPLLAQMVKHPRGAEAAQDGTEAVSASPAPERGTS